MQLKDQQIISELRANSRAKLTLIAKRTGIPISTVHDRIKRLVKTNMLRLVSLPNYGKIRMPIHACFVLNVKERKEAEEFLLTKEYVNTLLRINNGADLFCECVFPDFQTYFETIEDIKQYGKVAAYPVVEVIAKEQAIPFSKSS